MVKVNCASRAKMVRVNEEMTNLPVVVQRILCRNYYDISKIDGGK